ncbi:hypothetical protein L7F22_010178 [Adiantum nelumboides]|nr:hypothetical protein [Adiantum nelumboides]
MCVTEEEYISILQQAHSGQAGGHFSAEKMAKSILYAGICWPTLFKDAEEFIKRCDDCQRTKNHRGKDDMPLRPMMGARAFTKWGIDFVGPIAPPAYKSHAQYIIVAIDYLTKWVEAKATTKNDAKTTAQFLYENIFTRYGLPIEIVSDRGTHFINEVIENLLDEFMVIHLKSTPYHPQVNGQAESTNKILVTVLTKIVSESRTDWDQKLHSSLWAYRVAYKTSIGTTPFNMVYGIQAILLLEFLLPTFRVAKELEWTGHELSEQIEILEKLDETRLRAVASIYAQKRNMKSFFDQHVINKEFATEDYVLMYTLKQHSKKLQKRENGSYVIHDISPSGAIKLVTLEGEEMPDWISGCRLKKYHLPMITEMLAKIHSAKERKNKLKETKVQAQEEARIRILKRKQKLQQQRQPPIEETTPIPLATIQSCEQWQIGIDVRINVRLPNGQYQRALVDRRARVNVEVAGRFSTIGAIEGAHAIATGELVSLSEQELVSCVHANYGCNGGLMDPSFEWVVKNGGINTEVGYPYVSGAGTAKFCKWLKKMKKSVKIYGYEDVQPDNEDALTCAVAQQPVSVAINAGTRDFQLYAGGVFNSCSDDPNDIDHAVLAVGYGSDNGKDYWIVKNSWTEDWGLDGYVHIQRSSGNPRGVCGIHSFPSYPLGKLSSSSVM